MKAKQAKKMSRLPVILIPPTSLRNQRMIGSIIRKTRNSKKMMKSPLQRFGGSIQLNGTNLAVLLITSPRSVRDLVAFRTPFSRMIQSIIAKARMSNKMIPQVPLWQDPSAAQMQNLWIRRQVLSDGILTIIFENCIFIFGVGLWRPSYLYIYFLWWGSKIILFCYFLVEEDPSAAEMQNLWMLEAKLGCPTLSSLMANLIQPIRLMYSTPPRLYFLIAQFLKSGRRRRLRMSSTFY